ncbi:MAG TPA: low molecular weight phosphotyrosine protein phosphatase [Crenotrichaceae bacterium]|nr:low molecular weight phosphotyrosine protein phosphatase [Crenotrichaceae bacterium]
MPPKVKLLFVCMGNICRSPLAEGVFREAATQAGVIDLVFIDSAGTHAYHVGERPDSRSMAIASANDIDLGNQRARKVTINDFEHFDYVLAMDQDNYESLVDLCPEQFQDKIHLFLNFAPHLGQHDVPDPYYGGSFGFERVFDLVTDASTGLLEALLADELNEAKPDHPESANQNIDEQQV